MKKYLPYVLSFVIPFIFFARLFFPEPKLFYTPDYGASDIWNFNYPFKDFLSSSLKDGELPFWSKEVATGSPLFAESVIGGLYSINLLLFGLLPTWLAWNLSYLIHFSLGFLGSYLFFRRLGLSSLSGVFSAFSFSFGGFFIAHISHFSPVQTAALMPWIFLVADRIWMKPTKTNILLFAVLLSQQIFMGFVQVPFITLIGVFLFLIGQMRERNSGELVKRIGILALSVTLGVLLAAPQLLPSAEFKDLSVRKRGLTQKEIFQFPYRLKNLSTFVLPNAFGTPKDGSYPSPFTGENLGIYWENTAYMGLLPLLFLGVSFIHKKKRRWEKSFWFLAVFSILLALGKSSPLSFLYTFSVFNYFRVPSRFLLLTSFSIAALAGVGLDMMQDHIRARKSFRRYAVPLAVGAIVIGVVDVFVTSFTYHPLVSVTQALEPPKSLEMLSEEGRIFTLPSHKAAWNKVMFEKGWVDIAPYLYFKNGLDADLNVIFDRSHVAARSAIPTTRQSLQSRFLPKLLDTMAARYIISPEPLDEGDVLESAGIVESPNQDLPSYHVYLNKKSLDRFRLVSDYVVPYKISDLDSIFRNEDFSFADTVILETDLGEQFEELHEEELSVLRDEQQQIVLKTNTDKEAILVVADSFYPGWQALINGQRTQILPANVNQRALVVPAGENTIEMFYSPTNFYKGLVVSIGSLLIYILISIVNPRRLFSILLATRKKSKRS